MRPGDRSHCVHGHPLSGDNLQLTMRGPWLKRICRTCKEASRRAGIVRRLRQQRGRTEQYG